MYIVNTAISWLDEIPNFIPSLIRHVDWLFSGFKICSEIQNTSLPSQQLLLAASVVYSHLRKSKGGPLGSEPVKRGTDQCAVSRVLSWAEVSRDWYHAHNTSLLLTYPLCEIFMAHWPTHQGCHIMMCVNKQWFSPNTPGLATHCSHIPYDHYLMIFILQHITLKSSLLLLSGTFLSAT